MNPLKKSNMSKGNITFWSGNREYYTVRHFCKAPGFSFPLIGRQEKSLLKRLISIHYMTD